MSKKMLWYACLGLLCCSVFAIGVNAAGNGAKAQNLVAAKAEYALIQSQIAKSGVTTELQNALDKLQASFPGVELGKTEADVHASTTTTGAQILPQMRHDNVPAPTIHSNRNDAALEPWREANRVEREAQMKENAAGAQLNTGNASPLSDEEMLAQKLEAVRNHPYVHDTRPPENPLDQGTDACPGIDIGSALGVSVDVGTTLGFVDNFPAITVAPACGQSYVGFSMGGSDVFIKWTAPATGTYTFSLCDDPRDACIAVCNYTCPTAPTEADIICINDDAFGICADGGFASEIACLSLTGGTPYLIIIDAFGTGNEGDYSLDITECQPCVVECQPGDVQEVFEDVPTIPGDGDIFSGADPDGGCNNPSGIIPGVVTYQDINCGDDVCGIIFTYPVTGGFEYRDTDWLRFTLTFDADVTWSVTAATSFYVFILDGNCQFIVYAGGVTTPACGTATATALCLPPGDYVVWVGSSAFAAVPVSNWRGTLTCTPCVPPEWACCYGDPEAPSCDDMTSTACAELGGTWYSGLNCHVNFECPLPCHVICDPGDVAEVFEDVPSDVAEGDAFSGADPDGGCNNQFGVIPGANTYQDIACGDVVCGNMFTYLTSAGEYRDTDWLRFTTTVPEVITVTINAEFTVQFGILDITDCNAPFFLASNSSSECFEASASTVMCIPAGTYAIFVSTFDFGFPGAVDGYEVSLVCDPNCPEPPANDLCDNAIALAIPSVTAGSNVLSSDDLGFDDTDCGGFGVTASVWYAITGTGHTVTVTTCSPVTNFDTKLTSFCRGCLIPVCIASDDDDFTCVNSGLQSLISFCTQADCQYLIAVQGFGGSQGDFELTITDDGVDCQYTTLCCPLAAPCDPVNDLTIYYTTTNTANVLHWTAPQSGDYNVYSATSPNAPAYPDAAWSFEATVNTASGPASWTAPAGYLNFKYYIVVAQCQGISGRCCYGPIEDPSCADVTENDCTELGGTWDVWETCANPCPGPCVDFVIDAPGSVGPVSTCGAGDNCDFVVGGEDYSIQINIPHDGNWSILFCQPDGVAWDAYAFISTECCGGTILYQDDDGCQDNTTGFDDPRFVCITLAAGTYYADFEPYPGAPGTCGMMTCEVVECEPCVIECQPGDVAEVFEDVPTNAADGDVFSGADPDGGCNNPTGVIPGTTTYQDINCGDIVCGIGFTYPTNAGDYRDTDWFRFHLATPALVTWTVSAEYSNYCFILDAGCLFTVYAQSATVLACEDAVAATACLPPGDYVAWTGPAIFTGLPPSEYRGTLTCDPCPGFACNPTQIISSLPYDNTDNTCGDVNNSDETCPYSGSTSEDISYGFTPVATETISLSLCSNGGDTFYDSKIYVKDNNGVTIACNDDACSSAHYANYASQLLNVPVTGGVSYCIIVDGYGGLCGAYTLHVSTP